MDRYTAIVRGAVLSKMGVNSVKERRMRRHYGLVTSKIFRPGHDPESRKFVDIAGLTRCRDSTDWYSYKVVCLKNAIKF
jgi:hypothetical protein